MARACDREASEVGGLNEAGHGDAEFGEIGSRLVDELKRGSDG